MRQPYTPERGDLIWLTFDPQAGHKRAGRRPALVLSPKSYHLKTGMALICPVTSRVKGYPFEVALSAGLATAGVVLSDQIRNVDYKARQSDLIEVAPDRVIEEVLQRLNQLLK
ncbi:MAG: endoribonuclease MazF [Chthonomonadaceae bacterium]|nr:endoribonuclease MazF [Chthonomonadaceae bacterium]